MGGMDRTVSSVRVGCYSNNRLDGDDLFGDREDADDEDDNGLGPRTNFRFLERLTKESSETEEEDKLEEEP